MKIAFLNIYQGLVDRGAETFVSELSKRLSLKHELKIFSGEKLPAKRWPILWRFFLDPNGLSILLFTLRSLRTIWKEKYDVVIPINGGWQPALVRLVTWLYGGKMVISGQAGMGWDERNNLWCFPNTFVALSRQSRRWAERVNRFVKVIYIPNGVDLTRFSPQGEIYPTKLRKPIVLCVAALTSSKRVGLAIKAVAKLGSTSLMIVGDGNLKTEIQSLGKKLLKKRFQLIKVPHSDMPKVYRAADVFTIASEPYYAFEIVLVEAMATGLGVVANYDEIRKKIVGNAGILVNPTNVDEYAKALIKALKTNWGDKPQNQAKKFDWDKISYKYEELFNKIT